MAYLGYCTNVHAGVGLDQTLANLETHALAVRDELSTQPDTELFGLGLWLSATTVTELIHSAESESARKKLGRWFADRHLVPYTINAFPFGDFHGERVKHAVYEPAWWSPARADYTLEIAQVFHDILPPGEVGTISTLPIGWPHEGVGNEQRAQAALELARVAQWLSDLEQREGRHLRVCLEPEPGCLLDRTANVVDFFEQYLRPAVPEELIRRYLGICHDVCHATVMFESQDEVLRAYTSADIPIGKVQVSSAIVAQTGGLAEAERQEVLRELARFAEDRYLHQTTVRTDDGLQFFEDLPLALAALEGQPTDQWRVHFHVPLFLERFGRLSTSQSEIDVCLTALRELNSQPALEVETYAWDVLPSELKEATLAAGIAKEIDWLSDRLSRQNSAG